MLQRCRQVAKPKPHTLSAQHSLSHGLRAALLIPSCLWSKVQWPPVVCMWLHNYRVQ